MAMSKFIYLFPILLFSCLPSDQSKENSDKAAQKSNHSFIVEDHAWTDAFNRDEGVFGVDGIFAIPLNGREFEKPKGKDSTLFVFSDSLIKLKGKIKNSKLKNGEYTMIHNSLALAQGEDVKNDMKYFYREKPDGSPKTVFEPNITDGKEGYYFWLGDGFVNTAHDSSLYVFAYEIIDIETDGFFSFDQRSVVIIKIDKDEPYPYKNYELLETDLLFEMEDYQGKTTFGSAVLVNTEEAGAPYPDGYIYIYGCIGFQKDLLVARVLPKDFENQSKWKFWDGKNWNIDRRKAKKLVGGVSNEMSVSPLKNGQYILVFQHLGMEGQVRMQLSKSPYGPFYPPKVLYECPELKEDKDFFAYNAKAHPSLSSPDSLLISYNTNSFDFFVDVLTKTNLYRPRFIKIGLD